MRIEVQRIRNYDVPDEWNVRIDGVLSGAAFVPAGAAMIHAGLRLLEELAEGMNKSCLEMADEILKERAMTDADDVPCPRCKRPMQNMGNVEMVVYNSHPPQWDDTWVCHVCKVKKKVRVIETGTYIGPDLSDYEEVK